MGLGLDSGKERTVMGLQKESGDEVGPPCVGGMVPGVPKVDRNTPVLVGSSVLVSVGGLISREVRVWGGVDAGKSVGVSGGIESGKLRGGTVSQAVGNQFPSSFIVGGERWASQRVAGRKGGSSLYSPQLRFLQCSRLALA